MTFKDKEHEEHVSKINLLFFPLRFATQAQMKNYWEKENKLDLIIGYKFQINCRHSYPKYSEFKCFRTWVQMLTAQTITLNAEGSVEI